MGDVGDYWREHREYKRYGRKGAPKCTAPKNNKPYQCECGKRFPCIDAHKMHVNSKGKYGHKMVTDPSAMPEKNDPFDIEF